MKVSMYSAMAMLMAFTKTYVTAIDDDRPNRHADAHDGRTARGAANGVISHGRHIRQLYHVTSKLNGKVLALKGGSRIPLEDVILEPVDPQNKLSQIWYQDSNQLLRSALTNFVLGTVSLGAPKSAPEVIGCYADGVTEISKRDMPYARTVSDTCTLITCRDHCYSQGYPFAGAQMGVECWCGPTFGRYIKSSRCITPCAGDNSVICGGESTNTVIFTGHKALVMKPVDEKSPSSGYVMYGNAICNGEQINDCVTATSGTYSLFSSPYQGGSDNQGWILEVIN